MFSVPDGRMAIGLGIHGESGTSEDPLPAASQLADRLVDGFWPNVRPGRVTASPSS